MPRVDLREEASEEDALEVVELMRHTLLDEFLDGEGMLDFRRAGGKSKQVMRTRNSCAQTWTQFDSHRKRCIQLSSIGERNLYVVGV